MNAERATRQALREEYARLARDLSRDVIASPMPTETIRETFARLSYVKEALRLDERARQRAIITWSAIVMAITACVLIGLATWHVRRARVELRAQASRVRLQSAVAKTKATALIPARQVTFAAPDTIDSAPTTLALAPAREVKLAAAATGTITIEPIAIAAGDWITVESTGAANQFRLTIEPSETNRRVQVGVTLTGAIEPPAGGAARKTDFTFPGRVDAAWPAGQPAVLFYTVNAAAEQPALSFVTPLRARAIEFHTITPLDGVPVQESTIVDGTVNLPEYRGRTTSLEAGETLTVGDADLHIRRLAPAGPLLSIVAIGEARHLQVGAGDGAVTLMPTLLASGTRRHDSELVWGAIGALLSFFIGWLAFWRQPV